MTMSGNVSTVDILLLGGGGREHALLAKLAESPRAGKLYVAPGNGGMTALAEVARAADGTVLSADDPAAVAAWSSAHGIGLVVIGPEAPLVAGMADAVRAAGIACFGPSAAAARMEGSKRFAKEIMTKADVATARYQAFTDRAACEAYVRKVGAPVVVKADGLAAGKGVIVAATLDEALAGIATCFDGGFGDAGTTVVVEECLAGPECSMLALTDGTTVVPLVTAQDHKRAYDGDLGPNTGGMGAYSPVPAVSGVEYLEMVAAMERVVATLRNEGITYQGCLYGGFMLTTDGPKVLEFNARLGDPETQAVLPRMHADLVSVMLACDDGTLDGDMISWMGNVAVSVVLASAGYPGAYETGKRISGIAEAEALPGVTVYHAGTAHDDAGNVVTAGGRVLNVTAVAPTFPEARERAYAACDLIRFEGKTCRGDIAVRACNQLAPTVAGKPGGTEVLLSHALARAAEGVGNATAPLAFDKNEVTAGTHVSDMPRARGFVRGDDDPRDAGLRETLDNERGAWHGHIFDVNRLDVHLPDGRAAERDVVRHPGAVAIVALTDDGHICLVRQYRSALDRVTVEIPAGKLDAGEDPLDCANRELREETGMVAGRMAYLTTIATSVGFSDELIHLYMATDLTFVAPSPDDDEFINVDLVDLTELVDAVLDGRVEDAKTVVGALICDAVARRLTPDE